MDSTSEPIKKILQSYPRLTRERVKELRDVILSANVDLQESVKWNRLTYHHHKNICSIGVHKDHINLQFFQGAKLSDSRGKLEGSGKTMRHIKIRRSDTLDTDFIQGLIEQAWDIE